MGWVNIPNEVVLKFTGQPLQNNKTNADLEVLYKPFSCPAAGCDEKLVTVESFREHLADEHDLDQSNIEVSIRPEMENTTVANLITHLLLQFNDERKDNPFAFIRKTNDGYHSTEVWRRVQIALSRNDPVIRLKQDQYDWIHTLLDRKLPLTKDAKERGEEVQTAIMYLYGLTEDNVRQALKTLPERRIPEPDYSEVGEEPKELVTEETY